MQCRYISSVAISITPAAATDLPAIITLLAANKLPPAGIEDLVPTTLVAREGTVVVGSSALEPYGPCALLRSVAVDPARRGTGLGQQLTRAALDLARARGARTVYLITETAAGFFPRFGFTPIDREQVDPAVRRSVQFTEACPASALVMHLEL